MTQAVQSRLKSPDEYRQPHGARSPAVIYASGTLEGMERRFEAVPSAITPEEVSRFLRSLQVKIAEGECPRVYAVFNYSEAHWLDLEIDFTDRMIRFGDSMGGTQSSHAFAT